MGKVFYLLTFLASLDPTYHEAGENSRRALLETQMMKEEMVELENQAQVVLYEYSGLTKDDLVYAAYLYPIFAGTISTKPFKNFKYETENHWTIRPELEYGIWNKQATVYLGIVKEF